MPAKTPVTRGESAVCMAVPADAPGWLRAAIEDGGGRVVGLPEADGLIWLDHNNPTGLRTVLCEAPALRWVQLAHAGIDPYARAELLDPRLIWTSGKGVYAGPVAEHALMLALSGLRGLRRHIRRADWKRESGPSLIGASVTIYGRGGIAAELARLLKPFNCRIRVVVREEVAVPWADEVIPWDMRHTVLHDALAVFLALALTPQTAGLISAEELAQMSEDTWLVNVARGGHVVTDDLVTALRTGAIAGAALDVTDPEPLPKDHILWSLPNCIITSHSAVTEATGLPLLAARITRNVQRFGSGEPLQGVVEPVFGY